jgi:RNA polymerase sigma-70 factor (ECF subfamily)
LQVIDWQKIVKKHGQAVWQTAYRLLSNDADAADCFQETFVCALEVSRRQRVRNFSALLIRLATARAVDRLRQRYSDPSQSAADLVTLPGNNAGPVEQAETAELRRRLRKALAQLPPQEAQVFCLRYLNDMSYRQIAKELGIKTNAAGVMLHRARVKLREILQTIIGKED